MHWKALVEFALTFGTTFLLRVLFGVGFGKESEFESIFVLPRVGRLIYNSNNYWEQQNVHSPSI
jgi:hypothetical protein